MRGSSVLKIGFVSIDTKEEQAFRNAAAYVKATVQFYFLKTTDDLVPFLETGQIDMAIMEFPDRIELHKISKFFNKLPFLFLYTEQQKCRLIKNSLLDYILLEPFDEAMRLLPFYINKLLLEKSQNMFQWTFFQVLKQGSSLIVITDLQGNIEYVNSKFNEVTGYSFDDVVGKNPSCLKSGMMDVAVYGELWASLKAGKEWHGEMLNKRKNGTVYWEKAVITPLRSPMGEIYSYVKIAEDITLQKKASDKLRVSEERYRSVIDNISIGIAMVDKQMRVIALNRQMREWFPHVNTDDNPSCYQVLRGDNQDSICSYCPANQSFIDRKVHEVIIDSMINDKVVTYRILSCPIVNSEGEVVSVAELVEDVTEQRKAQVKLKEALEIQSEFTSMVSHELRTPLTAIKESINIVFDEITGTINEDQKEFLGLAKSNVDRLARLINDILDFQKLEAGKVSFHLQLNDLAQSICEVEKIMLPLLKEKNLQLDLDLESCPENVFFDNDRIQQVLTNLLSNAIKFTDDGIITISVNDEEDFVEVNVTDTGVGIKDKDMPRLFQKFEQLSKGHGRETGGTGLGLAISQQIIEQHNGSLWASSEYGKGTKFSFTLPKVADQRMWIIHKANIYLENKKGQECRDLNCALVVFKIKSNTGNDIKIDELGDDGNALICLMSIVQNHLPRSADLVIDPINAECIVFLPDFIRTAVADICTKIRCDFQKSEEIKDFPGINLKLNYGISFASQKLNTAQALFDAAHDKINMSKQLVIVDAQQNVLDIVVDKINSIGLCKVHGVLGARDGLDFIKQTLPDMVVLDVNMPEMNGYEVLGHLKGNEKTADIPVVLLTATETKAAIEKKMVPGSVSVFAKTDEGLVNFAKYINDELL